MIVEKKLAEYGALANADIFSKLEIVEASQETDNAYKNASNYVCLHVGENRLFLSGVQCDELIKALRIARKELARLPIR